MKFDRGKYYSSLEMIVLIIMKLTDEKGKRNE